jgi:mono/diheme cytochrome c family protein
MISARMRRAPKLLLMSAASISIAVVATACGTQRISVPNSQAQLYHGAVLFQQRCSGCHTLSYAATHGSASSVRTAEFNNGPNFDVRCERPIARVLYAIENGGFSGAIMPQNVVVGQDAAYVARFVATYAGRKSPKVPGVPTCAQKPVGSIPSPTATASTTGPTGATGAASTAATGPTGPASAKARHVKAKRPAKRKP